MYERLEGKNIVLRKAKMSDYESMLKNIWGDKRVYESMLFQPTLTNEDAIARCERSINFQKDHYAYFIALKDSDEAIGMCAIDEYEPHKFSECGIGIGVNYQGKGYGKEVLYLLLELTFDKLNGESFEYGYYQDNIKSKKVAEHFGFEYGKTENVIRPWDQAKKTIDFCYLTKEKWNKEKVGL